VKKKDRMHNGYTLSMEINVQTYGAHAEGQLLACEPATELPMAQRCFCFEGGPAFDTELTITGSNTSQESGRRRQS
jgi:hypothetical protein